jgi:hypothetical protein
MARRKSRAKCSRSTRPGFLPRPSAFRAGPMDPRADPSRAHRGVGIQSSRSSDCTSRGFLIEGDQSGPSISPGMSLADSTSSRACVAGNGVPALSSIGRGPGFEPGALTVSTPVRKSRVPNRCGARFGVSRLRLYEFKTSGHEFAGCHGVTAVPPGLLRRLASAAAYWPLVDDDLRATAMTDCPKK